MAAVRNHLLEERRAWVDRILACADEVTAGWDGNVAGTGAVDAGTHTGEETASTGEETASTGEETASTGEETASTSKRSEVVEPFRAALERRGLVEEAAVVLAECVRAGRAELPATPVAAPPYVVVTSRGLVLRANTDRGRLVVTVAAFEVDRDPLRYRRGARTPADAVEVAWR